MSTGTCKHTIYLRGYLLLNMTPSKIDGDAFYSITEQDGCISDGDKEDFFDAYFGSTELVDVGSNQSTGNSIPNTNLFFFQNNNSIQYYAPFSFFFQKYCADPCCYNEIACASQEGFFTFEIKNDATGRASLLYDLPRFGRLQNGMAKDLGADRLFTVMSVGIQNSGFTLAGSTIQKECNSLINSIKENLDCEHSLGGPCRGCLDSVVIQTPPIDYEDATKNPRFELMKQRYDTVYTMNSDVAPNIKQKYLRQKAIDLNQQL